MQYDNMWHMIAQGYSTDVSQIVHLDNSQRAKVSFHNSPYSDVQNHFDVPQNQLHMH